MTFGTKSIPKVDKIFGPGNQYVTVAKQLAAQHKVAIDLPAGPSELMVVADKSANPDFTEIGSKFLMARLKVAICALRVSAFVIIQPLHRKGHFACHNDKPAGCTVPRGPQTLQAYKALIHKPQFLLQPHLL